MRRVLALALLAACSGPFDDDDSTAINQPPVLQWDDPKPDPRGYGAQLCDDGPQRLAVRVADFDHEPQDLEVTFLRAPWGTYGATEVLGSVIPDAQGVAELVTSDLPQGNSQLTVLVEDPQGATAQESQLIVLVAPDEEPRVTILRPPEGSVFLSGETVRLEAETVLTACQDTTWLPSPWTSDVDGELGATEPDLDGRHRLDRDDLSVAAHQVSFVATTAAGDTWQRVVDFTVELDLPPSIPEVFIEPSTPSPVDNLLCVATSTDPNGRDVQYQYRWLLDGDETAFNSNAVPASQTAAGHRWRCEAQATDGTLWSEAASAEVVISAW